LQDSRLLRRAEAGWQGDTSVLDPQAAATPAVTAAAATALAEELVLCADRPGLQVVDLSNNQVCRSRSSCILVAWGSGKSGFSSGHMHASRLLAVYMHTLLWRRCPETLHPVCLLQLTSVTLDALACALADEHSCISRLVLSHNPGLPAAPQAAAVLLGAQQADPAAHRWVCQPVLSVLQDSHC
jgi:hypothetical protein